MIIRPSGSNGDMLPVLVNSDMLAGAAAEIELTKKRLKLLSGDWWENPSWGTAILEMMKDSRFTETDQQAISTYLSSYIRDTPGVLDVRDVKCAVEGKVFRYSCTIETEYGLADIQYEL